MENQKNRRPETSGFQNRAEPGIKKAFPYNREFKKEGSFVWEK